MNKKKIRIDLSGKAFGQLIVMNYSHTKNKRAFWNCICDCGNHKIIQGHDMVAGKILSCGCHRVQVGLRNRHNLTGQRIGLWTVLDYSHSEKYPNGKTKHAYWHCKCDCGTLKIVAASSLINQISLSCGCERSRGESAIILYLCKYNVLYIKEKTFTKCRSKHGGLLRFDFYLPQKNICIEYQGRQHYNPCGFHTAERVLSIQERDQIKRDYCKDNGIYLLEIKYTDYNNIESILNTGLELPNGDTTETKDVQTRIS